MVEFETIMARDVRFGNNDTNFIEVAKKKAITEEGENVFFSLARGFITPEGEKRYKKNFSIPADGKTLDAIVVALKEVSEGSSGEAPAEPAAESADIEDEE
ncbi:MAG: hypothetical protein HYS81_02130 [Candidatus Aenigmatarchaeota archaeon]|nr:MAG: hypothetical protein HYS81_02130 [Candidatus Aenigmarchaeota archaeon]